MPDRGLRSCRWRAPKCRRPRPAEPCPFGNQEPRSRTPRRPRPSGAPQPLPTNSTLSNESKNYAASTTQSPAATAVGTDLTRGNESLMEVKEVQSNNDDDTNTGQNTKRLISLPADRVDATSRASNHANATESDPLRHTGQWIPAEYRRCKQLPWTGLWTCCGNTTHFTTHCIDFEARMRHREAEHQRDCCKQLTRCRKHAADKFRIEWESEGNASLLCPNDDDNIGCSFPRQHLVSRCPIEGAAAGSMHQSKRPRPFLRQQWVTRLSRSRNTKPLEAATGYEHPASAVKPSFGSSCSSPVASSSTVTADLKTSIRESSSAVPHVGKDNVRSAVHLALSEAKVNAFVILGVLEGLSSVASAGKRPSEIGTTPDLCGTRGEEGAFGSIHMSTYGRKRSERGTINDGRSSSFEGSNKTHRHRRGTGENRGQRDTQPLEQRAHVHDQSKNNVSLDASIPCQGWGITSTVALAGGNDSSTSKAESGAALCVRLGAVPAVLGCLEEHRGHKKIEPMAFRLLRMFACDLTSSGAVRGNTGVATACAARMFPSAATPIEFDVGGGGTLGGSSTMSGASRFSSGNTSVEQEEQGYAGSEARSVLAHVLASDTDKITSGKSAEGDDQTSEAVDVESLSPQKVSSGGPRPTSRATSLPSKVAPHKSIEVAPTVEAPESSSAVPGRALAVDRPITTAAGAQILSDGATSSYGNGVFHPLQARKKSSERKVASRAAVPQPRLKLPSIDLVFVLSVAVQDSTECQRLILRSRGIPAMLITLRQLISKVEQSETESPGVRRGHWREDGEGRLSEMCLRVMEHLGQPERGRRRLVLNGSVETAIATIGKFSSDEGVLTAAAGLLLLLSDSPEGRTRILKAGGVFAVFEAMQRLVGNSSLQVKGAEMLQTLIKEEPQARRELDSIKGGWQWLCQGTSGGNALIHYAPGERHIPGWTLTEEERLTNEEALATAKEVALDWTPYNLATFMSTARSQHKFQIGKLAHFHFFRVVSEAGLLPLAQEDVEDWWDRLRRYEDERHIRVGNIARRRLARDNVGAHARSLGSSSASL